MSPTNARGEDNYTLPRQQYDPNNPEEMEKVNQDRPQNNFSRTFTLIILSTGHRFVKRRIMKQGTNKTISRDPEFVNRSYPVGGTRNRSGVARGLECCTASGTELLEA